MIKANEIIIIGIAAVLIGILLIFVGTALQSISKTSEVQAGGVIMIGPIPIIFGTDKSFVLIAMVFAVALMVISYLLFYRTPH
jgi:uncharacterized protein (TIGR00304 family)